MMLCEPPLYAEDLAALVPNGCRTLPGCPLNASKPASTVMKSFVFSQIRSVDISVPDTRTHVLGMIISSGIYGSRNS